MPDHAPPQYRTLAELQKAYEGGTTVAAVTEQYLAAIENLKHLNAVTAVNPKAMEEAALLDVRLTPHHIVITTFIGKQPSPIIMLMIPPS
jgi:Asp-tRNA(Asn)/Glu-tRNA(Gln) amidotransferase A subunit family amidase